MKTPIKKKEVKKPTIIKKKEYKNPPAKKEYKEKEPALENPDAKMSLCLSRQQISDISKVVKETRLKEYLLAALDMPVV